MLSRRPDTRQLLCGCLFDEDKLSDSTGQSRFHEMVVGLWQGCQGWGMHTLPSSAPSRGLWDDSILPISELPGKPRKYNMIYFFLNGVSGVFIGFMVDSGTRSGRGGPQYGLER